jgi:hypothetical protein
MVIGLGTDSTARWLGAIDLERVDVAELERAILEVGAHPKSAIEGRLRWFADRSIRCSNE